MAALDRWRAPPAVAARSLKPTTRSPRLLAPELAEQICACRRATVWGPRLVAGATGFGHSTVSRAIPGLSLRPQASERDKDLFVEITLAPADGPFVWHCDHVAGEAQHEDADADMRPT